MTLVQVIVFVLVAVDPLGAGVVAAALPDRRSVVPVALAAAGVLLFAAALAGPSLLDALDISAEAAEIAAGIVLLVPAGTLLWRGDHLYLLREQPPTPRPPATGRGASASAVLPLALPLLAGPAPLMVVAAAGAVAGRGDAVVAAAVALATAALACTTMPPRAPGAGRSLARRVAGRFVGAAMVLVAFSWIVDGVLAV